MNITTFLGFRFIDVAATDRLRDHEAFLAEFKRRHPLQSFTSKAKGGGGGAAQKPPAPIPPVTERTSEVDAASRQVRQDAAKRKGFKSTLLAGASGLMETAGARKTLLGQ